ncbi:phospholipid scramblase-related protein [Hymenobacter nivis]|uniref:Oxidoreductase n=1 Tax=Hymenobacter nivis TaxID=1850093 RepID=A0A502GVJ6_9BACT|nr:phospholipid scramblase-related protein [Hymenobacter nivis]TPG65428.1 oxidoreductase [Hymenobacter nivis]
MPATNFFARPAYFIREHIGFLKLKDTFDILDAETKEHIGYATEENPAWVNWTRLLLQKYRMPTTVVVRTLADDAPVLRLRRGWRFLRSKIRVYDGQDELLGYFESKILTLGGGFHVYNARGIRVADINGNWIGRNFRFLDAGGEALGLVTKKWAGIGRELFTTSDNYLISLTDRGTAQPATAALLLAAGLAVDALYKEARSQATGTTTGDFSYTPG